MPEPRRRHYGIAEIADALGLNRQLVTVWRRRRSWNMPEPDDELASGPLWLGRTIEPWIEEIRARYADETQEPLDAELARRAVRRLLRLAALVLEDRPREQLLARAHAELADVVTAVRGCASGAERERLLTALERVLDAGTATADDCLAAITDVVPVLLRLAGDAHEG
ncbi:hypothetical protein NLX83_29450 [Allokutzneria sp. A3M-2-11 16]|uniref:hypothetical protein n=1 Tax=Allokutzneria sp. A3M-2-11 16 TaxID=2962043 RepID=UPI0020B88DE4|nr:hypothetical protein [Allokutzneria sp. A3M-2-11 16]MCP3803408.1 hypothetical protein [Allokutzneria sp. A3M-2-11 16]